MKRLWNCGKNESRQAHRLIKMRSRLRRLIIESLDERIPLAADAQMIKDINESTTTFISSPKNFTTIGDTTFFSASTETYGAELWKTDGTPNGTKRVKDIRPGNGSSIGGAFTNFNNTLYFTANDGVNGYELWKSDGTEAGTTIVKDISIGEGGSLPNYLTVANGMLFFQAGNDLGFELWKSNGTEQGTVLVKDISTTGSSRPSQITNVKDIIYFSAFDSLTGMELWKSDGSSNGTTRVKDIRPGNGYSDPRLLSNIGGVLYFTANDGTNGVELWKSDGTAPGTHMIRDIRQGANGSSISGLTGVGSTVFFAANQGTEGIELWKSDGTLNGTNRVKDINPGSSGSFPQELTNLNGKLLFSADNGASGEELWQSDGSDTGTTLVKNIASIGGSSPASLINFNGILVFAAHDDSNGRELWRSDGTSNGTVMLKDVYSGWMSSMPSNLYESNGSIFFVADGGLIGPELWISNGETNGTSLLKDISYGTSESQIISGTNIDGTYYFGANNGADGNELWRSNGEWSGTVQVRNIASGAASSLNTFGNWNNFVNANGMLFFTAQQTNTGVELWKSNGTDGGTSLVLNIRTGSYSSSPRYLTNVNGIIFFQANDGTTGEELWKSDGTTAGTLRVKDICPGSIGSGVRNLVNVGGTLYFRANNGVSGYELWKSDGTHSGTVLVKDIRTGISPSFPSELLNVNGKLFFSANDGSAGSELWTSDGSETGTVRVQDIASGSFGSYPKYLTNVNGTLYFSASDLFNTGRELWKSDGTSGGTQLIKDIHKNSNSNPNFLTNVGGALYFTANDGTNGFELWRSDGSNAGTGLVRDIRIGIKGSDIQQLTNVNGWLCFRADSGLTGYQVWISDGTSTGTRSLSNALSMPTGIAPLGLTNTNGILFYTALSEGYGRELWKASLPDLNPPPSDIGLSSSSIQENAGANAIVGSLSTTDPIPGDSFTYTLVSGSGSTDNAAFNISGNALRASSSFDFETKSSYSVRVRSTDQGGLWTEKVFTISVTDVNETPTNINLSANSITENAGANATVGILTTADPDAANTFAYTLVSGTGDTDNAAFNISGTALRASSSFDFETKSSYSVRVRSTDQGGLWTEKIFNISVTDVNETPSNINLSANSIAENAGANATVGTLTTTDPDAANTFAYNLVSGTGDSDNAAFNISANALRASNSFDFEAKSSYSVRIRSTDQGGLYTEKVFTINVTNTNDAPILNPGHTASMGSVLEGASNPSGISIADLLLDGTITDQDGIAIKAIAINGVNTTLGTWQFRLNGNSLWNTINSDRVNSQTNELVLLLGPSAQLRMIPFGSLNGSITDGISYRAWDMTSGTQGTYTEVSSVGGTTPFSLGSALASIDVTAVNNAPTFRSGDGIVSTRIGANQDLARSVVVQPDGKILLGGYGTFPGSSHSEFAIVRYNQDGSVDSTFGSGGKAITDFFGNRDVIYSVALQPDGKIVVGGLATIDAYFIIVALARYNTDGSLDISFGTGGKVTTGIAGQELCTSIMIRDDGKIVVAGWGYAPSGTTTQGIIIQYNANGSLDTGFGTGGMVSFSQDAQFWGAVLQADGKVVAGGSVGNNFGAERYNANGSIDISFGVEGKASTDFNNSDDYGRAIAIQQDGKIVALGLTLSATGTSDVGIVRYNTDGSLDTTFGQNGKVVSSPSNGSDEGLSITIQRDGKILVTGSERSTSQKAIFVSRYNTNGSLDSTFGTNGSIRTAFTNGYAIAQAISVQLDGKILVGGTAPSSSSNQDFVLVRYNPDGSLDTTFDLIDTFGGSVNYVENGTAVVMDNNVKVMDAELRSSNYSGATLSLRRVGGANPQDAFKASGVVGSLNEGNDLVVTGVAIGTVTTNSNGTLLLSFNSAASNDLVNTVLQSVAYENLSDSPPQSVQILWDFNDGNQGAQGLGGASSATGTVTINITSVNDNPNDISLTPNFIAENAGANATVGTFLTTDPDAADTFTYTLVTGDGSTDNAAFNISGTALRASSSFDFETKSNYSIRIRSTDQGGLWTEKVFNISVSNVNEAPTSIILSASSIAENAGANATVGTLSTTDPDAHNTFTYSLVSGSGSTDNAAFNISGNTLRATSNLDYETMSIYSIRVRSTDQSGLFTEKVFVVKVTNINETPTELNISSLSIAENSGADAFIGTLNTVDDYYRTVIANFDDFPILPAINGYANLSDLNNGSNNYAGVQWDSRFQIVGRNYVELWVNQGPNTYAKPRSASFASFNANGENGLALQTTKILTGAWFGRVDLGNGPYGATQIVIHALNGSTTLGTVSMALNSTTPSFMDTSLFLNLSGITGYRIDRVAQSGGIASRLGSWIAEDFAFADPSASNFTYTLVAGDGSTDNAAFNISANALRASSSFDFETKSSYSARVRSTDQGGLWTEKVFTISVLDVNEFAVSKPVDSNSAPNTILSTAAIGTPVGITALASDLDGSNNSVTYSLDDSANGLVAIDPVSGVVTLAASIVLTNNETLNITVRATSSDGSSDVESFSIQIQTVIDLVGTSGADQFVVNHLGANLWSVTRNGTSLFNGTIFTSGLLRIDGLQGSDTIAIYGTNNADSFRVREDRSNLNGLDIIHLQTEQRSVWGLGSNDTFQIESSLQGVYGGDGQDRIVLADPTKTVITLDAGSGYDTLDYSLQAGPISYSIGGTTSLGVTQMISVDKIIGSQGSDSLVGQNVLTDWAITGPDQIQVSSIDYHSFENLVGGTAVDRFQLWDSTAKLSGIANGGSGSDRLTANDKSNTWQLNGSKAGSILNTITFADVEALVGGTGNDQYLVQPGALFASVAGGSGQDELNYSSYGASVSVTMSTSSITAAGLFSSIESIVGSSQTDAFTAGNATNTWVITGNAAGQVSGIQFASFELLRGGSGADTFQVQAGAIPNIFGGSGTDTIVGPNTPNTWKVSATAAGTLNSTTAFREFENITGGSESDLVELTSAGSISGTLSGGLGTNTLSYQSFASTRSAEVNVTTNKATGIATLAANFQVFIGGAGNDKLIAFPNIPSVLIGNAGNDQITGSSDRDILIGGGGADVINGGGGQDILIGGSSSYDLNPQALSAIRNEWLSTRTYAERIGNLRGTATTGAPLNNGFYFQPGPTGTLSGDSGQVDSLFGQSDTDWFIAESNDLTDRLSDEQLLDPLGN